MASGLQPSDPSLLYAGSADDPRLGNRIEAGVPARRGIALLGFADDRAVVNGRGRPGAALGPAEIRRFLSRLTPGDRGDLDGVEIRDLGDAAPSGSIEETHALVEEAALEALRAGACVVLLGGGHDGAFASHSALLRAVPGRVGAVNVDAHLDVRPLRDGKITSGTPFRRLAERWGDRYGLVEFGIQPQHNALAHREFCEEHAFPIVTLAEAREQEVARAFERALAQKAQILAVSLDLDSVEAASAPGVSAPCPDGFTAAELFACARTAGEHPAVRVLDVMELSPPLDQDSRTARLAAMAIWSFLAGYATRLSRLGK
jgi:formimidoylglutamase